MTLRSCYLIAALALPIGLLGLPSVATGQTLHVQASEPSAATAPVRLSEVKLNVRLKPVEASPAGAWAQRDADPDSLANGTLIGALVGATAAGIVGGAMCKLFQEPTDPSCIGDAFKVAAVGAAIGAGTGLAIDAAMSRQGGVRVTVKKRF